MPRPGDLVGTSLTLVGGPAAAISQQASIANAASITAPAESDSSADLVLTQALRTTVNNILVALRTAGIIDSP